MTVPSVLHAMAPLRATAVIATAMLVPRAAATPAAADVRETLSAETAMPVLVGSTVTRARRAVTAKVVPHAVTATRALRAVRVMVRVMAPATDIAAVVTPGPVTPAVPDTAVAATVDLVTVVRDTAAPVRAMTSGSQTRVPARTTVRAMTTPRSLRM